MSTSISIKGKTQGNESTTATVNYVNPDATNAQLVSLASALNNLTTNTISDVTKISKESLTDSSKLNRNMQIIKDGEQATNSITISYETISTSTASPTELTITYNGAIDGESIIQITRAITSEDGFLFMDYGAASQTDGTGFWLVKETDGGSWTGTITISLPATEIYEADSVTINITA